MSSRKDSDLEILKQSKFIADGIEALNDKLKFNELKLINSIDSVLHYKDSQHETDISNIELVSQLRNYIKICEYKRLQYKC